MEFTIIKELIDKIMEQVIMLPAKEFNPLIYQIENRLNAELGYIAFFADVIPKLFQDIKIKQITDYSRQKYKVRKAIKNFIKIIVKHLDNVYIHLDDLQWTDENSLDIIKSLIKDKSIDAVFILSYRDEFKSLAKEEKNYGVTKLEALTETEVNEMIVSLLSGDINNSEYLARYISSVTLGNPFYVTKVIDEFTSKRIIECCKNKKFLVHMDRLTKLNISENINEVMISRIAELETNEVLFLEYLSCLGGQIDKIYIEKICCDKSSEIVEKLIEKSFIFATNQQYGFTHDIIFEYVFDNINSAKREQLYFDIAKELTDFNKTDKNIWPLLVNAIINSVNVKWSKQRKEEWYYILAEVLKYNMNYKKTLEILSICKKLMDENKNLEDCDILLKLSKCKYLLGDFQGASKLYEQMKEGLKDKARLLKIEDERMSMFAYIGDHQAAMDTGIKMLGILDFEYNINNMEDLILKFKNIKKLNGLDEVICAEEIESKIDEQYILYKMIPSAKIICQKHFLYSILLIADLAIKKTESKYRLFGLTACSFIMFNVLNNFEMGEKLSDIVKKNVNFDSEEEFVQETLSFYLTFVHHWSNDIVDTIQLLEKNNLNCLERGIVNYFEYSLASLMFAYCVTGKNVIDASKEIRQKIEMLDITSVQGKQFSNTYVNLIFDNYAQELKCKKVMDIPLSQIEIEDVVGIWFSILANYINGYVKETYQVISLLRNYFPEVKGHIVYADMIFVTTLIMLEHYENLEIDKKIKDELIISKNRDILKGITSFYEENHLSRYLLLEGMYEKIFGDSKLAIGYINEGISLAKKKNNYLLLVLGNKLAQICSSTSELERFYSSQKEKALEKYTLDVDKTDNLKSDSISENSDVFLILKTIREMKEKDAFGYFLDYIVDEKLCDYTCILINKNDRYEIAYEKKEKFATVQYNTFLDIKEKVSIDRELLTIAERLSDTIIKNKIDNQQNIIVIVPIKIAGIKIGMLYLETSIRNQEKVLDIVDFVLPCLVYKLDSKADIDTDEKIEMNNDILTPREVDILKHLSKGESNQKISELEFISVGTVKSHLNKIYAKLGVKNRRKAIIIAKEKKII